MRPRQSMSISEHCDKVICANVHENSCGRTHHRVALAVIIGFKRQAIRPQSNSYKTRESDRNNRLATQRKGLVFNMPLLPVDRLPARFHEWNRKSPSAMSMASGSSVIR
eukprot:6183184-Pleurochrysis_carterae.AAC.3